MVLSTCFRSDGWKTNLLGKVARMVQPTSAVTKRQLIAASDFDDCLFPRRHQIHVVLWCHNFLLYSSFYIIVWCLLGDKQTKKLRWPKEHKNVNPDVVEHEEMVRQKDSHSSVVNYSSGTESQHLWSICFLTNMALQVTLSSVLVLH